MKSSYFMCTCSENNHKGHVYIFTLNNNFHRWKPTLNRQSSYIQERGERGGSVVECRTPEREVRGSRPTAAVLCPWARHFTPRKYWLLTQEAMAPSRHDWKIVDWDVKPQHNQHSRTTLIIDKCKSWLADVMFDWRHVMVTAVECNNQTRRIITFLRRFFARFKSKFHK